MMTNFLSNVDFTAEFLFQLEKSIDAQLLSYTQYAAWCDKHILKFDIAPMWMINLSLEKDHTEAATIVRLENYTRFSYPAISEDYFNCALYVSYKFNQITWNTFLEKAGFHADANHCFWQCEEFFDMLNKYNDSSKNDILKDQQDKYYYQTFHRLIDEIKEFYTSFVDF
jgi:hypothetical protein